MFCKTLTQFVYRMSWDFGEKMLNMCSGKPTGFAYPTNKQILLTKLAVVDFSIINVFVWYAWMLENILLCPIPFHVRWNKICLNQNILHNAPQVECSDQKTFHKPKLKPLFYLWWSEMFSPSTIFFLLCTVETFSHNKRNLLLEAHIKHFVECLINDLKLAKEWVALK